MFINIFSKSRYFLIGICFVGSVFLVLVVLAFFNPLLPQNGEATLLLAYENNGQGRMFTGKVVNGMTVLDALIVSSQAGQIGLKYDLDDDGRLVILQLDGYDSENSDKKLAFYLNQKRIDNRLIVSTTIQSDDYIEVKLE